ncbi:ABC transporter ATP-binding protein [Aggregatilineales bacterium SYSU G02658]
MVLLEAHNLRMEFGRLVAVDDVSLSIAEGSVHSIIGPNGAGKTTCFNLLTGKYKPTRGRVIFRGQDITHLPMHRRAHLGIGRSYQITNIFPNLSVLENVRLAAQALSADRWRWLRPAYTFHTYLKRAYEVIELVGLTAEVALPGVALAHGAKRKLELAIILASDPVLLLLDEPTAGMASEQVPELLQTIERIRREANKTIVMVEHNMNVVMNISDRITVMHQGALLAEGTPAEIANNPQVQQVYLGDLYDLSEVGT